MRFFLERIRAYGLTTAWNGQGSLGVSKGVRPLLETTAATVEHESILADPRFHNQMDYLFASSALAERAGSCDAFDSAEWRSRSDHLPIAATVRGLKPGVRSDSAA